MSKWSTAMLELEASGALAGGRQPNPSRVGSVKEFGAASHRMTFWSGHVSCPAPRPKFRSHPHQVSEGIRLHLLHDLPSMRFHCDLADAELAADLFIQHAGDDQCHHFAFARSKGSVLISEFLHLHVARESKTAAFKGLPDRTQQHLVVERFR